MGALACHSSLFERTQYLLPVPSMLLSLAGILAIQPGQNCLQYLLKRLKRVMFILCAQKGQVPTPIIFADRYSLIILVNTTGRNS